MTPGVVIPFNEPVQLSPKILTPGQHLDHTCAFLLEGSDLPFHHSDAAVFAHGTKAWRDVSVSAPFVVCLAIELFAVIVHDVLGLCSILPDCAIQEVLDGPGSWP